jgi:hypothetical protein
VQDASTTVFTANTAINQYRVHRRKEVHKQQTLRHHIQHGVDDPAELHQDLEKKDLKIEAKNRQEKNLSQKTTHQKKKKTHQKNSKNQAIQINKSS